jgi:hypothetical protein
MKQELVDAFRKLKFCTEECIEVIKSNNYEPIEELMIRRQKILDSISDIHAQKEDKNTITKELGIFSLEKKLADLIKEKKSELRNKINNIEKNKTAANSYNSRTSKNAVFFSKKI